MEEKRRNCGQGESTVCIDEVAIYNKQELVMRNVLLTITCVFLAGNMAFGHWDIDDGHKMHYPQLPDPEGWDIHMAGLADDWLCIETGPVEDIHIWYSVKMGDHINPPHFQTLGLSIHSNVPAGVDVPYSHPSDPDHPLWWRHFQILPSMINGPWHGRQGWDEPTPDSPCNPDDHTLYWQLNLTDIVDPFIQQEGEIYWLSMSPWDLADPSHEVGWKTTSGIFEDPAVYRDPTSPVEWSQIQVCNENRLTDLAFVITPEPGTMILLGMGSFTLLRRRRRL